MAAALEILYRLTYYIALKRMDTSVICVLFSLSKILLPVLAWLMLDEHLHTRQYLFL